MPGQPVLQELSRQIEEEGGDYVILDRVAVGQKSKEIMASYGLSSAMMYVWIHKDEEREKRWARIRKLQEEMKQREKRCP